MKFPLRPVLLAALTGAACRSAPPTPPQDPLQAGIAAYERGEWSLALENYEAALQATPDDPQLLDLHGETLLELGRLDEALGSLDRSIEIDSRNPFAHAHRGQVLAAMGRSDEAAASFQRAVELAPDVAHFQQHLERARGPVPAR